MQAEQKLLFVNAFVHVAQLWTDFIAVNLIKIVFSKTIFLLFFYSDKAR